MVSEWTVNTSEGRTCYTSHGEALGGPQLVHSLLTNTARHTGTTELPLTANGEKRIIATGRALVGDDRLIVPKNLAHMYVAFTFKGNGVVLIMWIAMCHRENAHNEHSSFWDSRLTTRSRGNTTASSRTPKSIAAQKLRFARTLESGIMATMKD